MFWRSVAEKRARTLEGIELDNSASWEWKSSGGALVVEIDKRLQELSTGPGIARVVFGSEATCRILINQYHNYLLQQGLCPRPSVKSIETRLAPASKQPLISFSHCSR